MLVERLLEGFHCAAAISTHCVFTEGIVAFEYERFGSLAFRPVT